MSDLLQLIKGIQADKKIPTLDEASTKMGVILPILKELGWNPFNVEEIHPEYSVGSKNVDYSLRYGKKNKVFIEVKQTETDLDKHQPQLLNYSFSEGVRLAILTNGIAWWFYLPLHEGSWEQRKFYVIDIQHQLAEDIAQKFEDLLRKQNIISGAAITNAEKMLKIKLKGDEIRKSIPEAWNTLMTEQDQGLLDLIAEATERVIGYKPDDPTIAAFLSSNSFIVTTPFTAPVKPKTGRKKENGKENYTGTSLESFTFRGVRYDVRFWKDLLIGISEIMLANHKDTFPQILNLVGRKRPYFTRNPDELRVPERIDDIDIFVEINVSANQIVRLAISIVSLFGYSQDDLKLDFKKPE
jgi:predicted type IV restriction endonuclease